MPYHLTVLVIIHFCECSEPIIDAQFTEIENQLIKDGIPKEKINKFKVDALVKFEKRLIHNLSP